MKLKTFVIFGLLVVLAFSLHLYFKPKPLYHFSRETISSILPPTLEWTGELITPEATDKIRDILSLKYQFLGKGKQAFSFVSEDDKYVVKFFNLGCVIPTWKDFFYPQNAREKQKRLKRLFFGYNNGYQELKEDTGLIWIHLKPTNDLKRTITLVDSQKNELHLDADSTIFVIQKKAEPIFIHLSKLYEEGKSSEADQLIQAFYALIQRRASKGFHDRDKIFQNNYGFVENQPIQFDLGKNKQMEKPKDELEYFKAEIEKWKAEHDYQ
jgi:hypothetical protein